MDKRYHIAFLLLFFVSGFSGLIYESIWTNYLKLFLGHAAYAQTLVLVIFMGGMAIGSYLASHYSWKWKNLFLGYAIAEGIIGLFALVFHESFTTIVEISFNSVIQNLGSPFYIDLYKWTIAACLILPQSILLGTTFPLMSAAILRTFPCSPGKNISLLYFINSIGAAIGVLVSGFYFVDAFGLPGTIRIAGVLNILIALMVMALIRKKRKQTEQLVELNIEQPIIGQKTTIIYFSLLGVSAFTGMSSFIYEIGWIRMLNLVLGTSTHAFELMLSAFILGLAFGGLWMRKRIDSISNPIAYLGFVQIIMGISALSTLLIYGNTFNLMQWILESTSKDDSGYFIFNLSSNGIALLIMFPTAFFAGMTLPLITTILLTIKGEKSIGSVYGWNIIGAITGVFTAVHFGMPLLGLKGLISLGAGIDIVLGLLLLFVLYPQKTKFTLKSVAGSMGIVALLYCVFCVTLDPYKMGSGVYNDAGLMSAENTKILFYEDGKTATVSVVLHKDEDILSIRTNGKSDASLFAEKKNIGAVDEYTMIQIAVIPMAFNPRAKDVANIGLGAGFTTKTVLANPHIQSIHTIEIEEEMVNAAKMLGPQVDAVFSDPRSKIVLDDAKSFFASGQKKYDIILSEPSNPWISGVSGLFSLEFYSLIREHLNKDGVFAQWLQLYSIDLNSVASVLKAVSQSFPDYEVYILNEADCLIVAKKDGLLPPLDTELLKSPAIADALSHIEVNNLQDIEFRLLGNKNSLDPFLASFPIKANSDYYPILEQNATRMHFLHKDAREIYSFTHHLHPVISLLNPHLPRWNETKITSSPFYAFSQQANEAIALRDFYLQDNFDLHYSFLPEEVRLEAKQTKRSFGKNSNYFLGQNRVALLLNTSIRITPYLTSSELEQVWTSLGIDQDTTLTNEERAWFEIILAISKKDAKMMVETGEFLLKKGSDLPDYPKEYLVSAVMLGYILEDKLDEAQITWHKYKDHLSDDPRSKMLFRFLVAQCKKVN